MTMDIHELSSGQLVGLMDKLDERQGITKGLERPLTMQYHAPGSWLLFTFGHGRGIHLGTFTAGSLKHMSLAAERLQLVWDAAAGKTNDQLRAEVAYRDMETAEAAASPSEKTGDSE